MAATARGVPAATSLVLGVPLADAKAFTGHGRLAFVSSGRLYVLDGTARGMAALLRAVVVGKVAAGQVPGSPAWSADGKWLAFLTARPGGAPHAIWEDPGFTGRVA